jgi:hypothetical protein
MRVSTLIPATIAVFALTITPRAQADLNGSWALSFNTPNGTIDATATFKQEGEALSGTLSSQQGEVPFKGSVKGSTFTVGFEVQTSNGPLTITMQGEQDGDAIKGTFDFGQGMGDWTGKRK